MHREGEGYKPSEEKEKPPRFSKVRMFAIASHYKPMSELFTEEMFERLSDIRVARERFWNMLIHYVEKAHFSPKEGEPVRILELGCGTASQAETLRNYFSGGHHPFDERYNIRAEYVGIDNDKYAIGLAIEDNSDFVGDSDKMRLKEKVEFIAGDATNLGKYKGIPSEVDFVMVRHPRTVIGGEDFEIWHQIFEQGLKRLSPEGIMLVTFYSAQEAIFFQERILSMLNAAVVVNAEKNPEQGPPAGISKVTSKDYNYDNIVMVLRKR